MQEQPVSGRRFPDSSVIAAGLFTTVIMLFIVFWLPRQIKDFDIMGWYGLFIVPVGAILVGIGAGSGYGLMSWFKGRKITGSLLAVIVALLALAYAAAQWVEFKSLNLERYGVDFFKYFDVTTRSMTFKAGHSSTPSGSLGLLGYLFRLLELAGFSLGGLFIPIMLRAKPYCENCLVYMRKGSRWWLPAAVPTQKISKKDPVAMQAYQREMDEAHKKGAGIINSLIAAVKERDVSTFRSLLRDNGVDAKAARKLFRSFFLTLHSCPQCRSGRLEMQSMAGQGDKVTITRVGLEPVDAGFVAALGDLRPANSPRASGKGD